MQQGNSLDSALVLCSFLVGVGYNAYTVIGYASQKVTLKDERETEYPLEKISLEDREKDAEEIKSDSKKEQKYRVKPLRQLKSNFLTKQAEKQKGFDVENERKRNEVKEDLQKVTGISPSILTFVG